jgi:signal recognition particle GTPase
MYSILLVWQNVSLNGRCCSLVERAQEQFDEEARRIQRKSQKRICFDDFTQIQQVKKMGMKDLVGMIPGAQSHEGDRR